MQAICKEMNATLSTFLSLTLHLAAGSARNTLVFISSNIPCVKQKSSVDIQHSVGIDHGQLIATKARCQLAS